MGLMDILNGMENGPRGAKQPTGSSGSGSGGMSPMTMALIGLLAWNLFVYVALIVTWIRARGRAPSGFWFAHFYERWIAGRIESLMRHSTRYNVPLTTGLRRFAGECFA